jgi:hypothetical protein
MNIKWILTICISALIIGGCSNKEENHDGHVEGHHAHTLNGDLQELTASADVLPSFLDNQTEELKLVYQAAGKAHEVLEWMPCYCGCADSAGHQSNKNCFIAQVNEDGSIKWDDHGTRCQVCVEIAVQSIIMTQEGKSLKEIRDFIDEKYKDGYATPTKTPMPV